MLKVEPSVKLEMLEQHAITLKQQSCGQFDRINTSYELSFVICSKNTYFIPFIE